MIIVTKNEFFNFIKSQPDDKELDFNQFAISTSCGCPMIHYAREILQEHNLNASDADWYGINSKTHKYGTHFKFENGFSLASFMPYNYQSRITYGELKQYLSGKYPEFNWAN